MKTFIATTNLLDLRRAARRLGATPAWLALETEAGRVPGLCAEGQYLYDWSALEEALLERARHKPMQAKKHKKHKTQ